MSNSIRMCFALMIASMSLATKWNPNFYSSRLPRGIRVIIQDPLQPQGTLLAYAEDVPKFWQGYYASNETATWIGRVPPAFALNAHARTLCALGTNVFAGGDFTWQLTSPAVDASHIVVRDRHDGPWAPLITSRGMQGVNQFVTTMVVCHGNLYIGGAFTRDNSIHASSGFHTLNRIAMWNESARDWVPLGTGLNDVVYSIACG
jgi:hypothetical protein